MHGKFTGFLIWATLAWSSAVAVAEDALSRSDKLLLGVEVASTPEDLPPVILLPDAWTKSLATIAEKTDEDGVEYSTCLLGPGDFSTGKLLDGTSTFIADRNRFRSELLHRGNEFTVSSNCHGITRTAHTHPNNIPALSAGDLLLAGGKRTIILAVTANRAACLAVYTAKFDGVIVEFSDGIGIRDLGNLSIASYYNLIESYFIVSGIFSDVDFSGVNLGPYITTNSTHPRFSDGVLRAAKAGNDAGLGYYCSADLIEFHKMPSVNPRHVEDSWARRAVDVALFSLSRFLSRGGIEIDNGFKNYDVSDVLGTFPELLDLGISSHETAADLTPFHLLGLVILGGLETTSGEVMGGGINVVFTGETEGLELTFRDGLEQASGVILKGKSLDVFSGIRGGKILALWGRDLLRLFVDRTDEGYLAHSINYEKQVISRAPCEFLDTLVESAQACRMNGKGEMILHGGNTHVSVNFVDNLAQGKALLTQGGVAYEADFKDGEYLGVTRRISPP
ncbi:hypothetical protein EQ718_10060 [Paracoccus versutus]|uniref:Uncharacterized protein n=1 Tax=Paracoccus versutus TaxID=34007 RepID=A0AAQ0HHG0_PARVE|nr:hypothetical protein [Paracoccus versutus]REG46974.1 hypothetical protein ATH84_1013103 [Paracoccus versutus]WEJ79192.1 hypothetical protein EQ718_10060 [Paracoccus versutus]